MTARSRPPCFARRPGESLINTNLVYTQFVKNVTISLDDDLLQRSRKFAGDQGMSFNEFVRDLLRLTVDDSSDAIQRSFELADKLGLSLPGGMPSREERNAR